MGWEYEHQGGDTTYGENPRPRCATGSATAARVSHGVRIRRGHGT
ncbi:unnamed protein product, partial [marine sediment metagenome]